MDAFKFAFETTIVGLLTLPWLAMLVLLFLPGAGQSMKTSSAPFAKLLEPAALGVTIVTLAYFMGSAVTPVATQLLDDPDMPMLKIRQIRASALGWWLTDSSSLIPGSLLFVKMCQPFGSDICNKEKQNLRSLMDACDVQCTQAANGQFLFQEQTILRDGTDKTERLSRLHEQVIVLRGADRVSL